MTAGAYVINVWFLTALAQRVAIHCIPWNSKCLSIVQRMKNLGTSRFHQCYVYEGVFFLQSRLLSMDWRNAIVSHWRTAQQSYCCSGTTSVGGFLEEI